MVKVTSPPRAADPLEPPSAQPEVAELLEALLHAITDRPESPAALELSHHDAEIVWHTEWRGARYTITRQRASHPEPVGLSPREHEIVRLVAKGLPNKCIADVLEISPWTVATHLRRIFGKLEVTSRAAMIARSIELSLLGASASAQDLLEPR